MPDPRSPDGMYKSPYIPFRHSPLFKKTCHVRARTRDSETVFDAHWLPKKLSSCLPRYNSRLF